MASDFETFEKFLNEQPLLLEEKAMWYRLGFYVYPGATYYDNRTGTHKTILVDAPGNQQPLDPTLAKNLRISVIRWWQAEKAKPRATELKKTVETGPFDELEVTRGE